MIKWMNSDSQLVGRSHRYIYRERPSCDDVHQGKHCIILDNIEDFIWGGEIMIFIKDLFNHVEFKLPFAWALENISSMNMNITSGLHVALCRTSSSKLAMDMFANWVHMLSPWQYQKFGEIIDH